MDKITGISNGSPVPEPQKVDKKEGDLFKQNLIDAQAKKADASDSTRSVASLGEVTATTFPQFQSADSTRVVQKTGALLDLLENYAREIENPDKTLKDLEPLIDMIRQDASRLLEAAGDAEPGDTDLKRIATEAAVTANVEYVKFYRGDYI